MAKFLIHNSIDVPNLVFIKAVSHSLRVSATYSGCCLYSSKKKFEILYINFNLVSRGKVYIYYHSTCIIIRVIWTISST